MYIYHLFTETERNNVFCGPETANNGGPWATFKASFHPRKLSVDWNGHENCSLC